MPQLQANHSNIHQANIPAQIRSCHHCGSHLTNFARFCGECGASGMNTGPASVVNFASVQAMSPMQSLMPQPRFEEQQNSGFQYPQSTNPGFIVSPPQQSAQSAQSSEWAPKFAAVAPQITHVDPALRSELAKNIMLLARERMFLYMHCLFFPAFSLFFLKYFETIQFFFQALNRIETNKKKF